MTDLVIKNYIGYRSEEVYGEGERDLLKIIKHEFYELGNTDILNYFLEHKLTIETNEQDMFAQVLKCVQIIINGGFTKAVWLCDKKKYVKEYYNVSKESIYQVRIERGYIISDLGKEGKLIAYKED